MLPLRYRLLRLCLYLAFRVLTRLDVRGLERLPRNGPYMLVSNHLHLFDAPLIFALLGSRDATGWVGSTHRSNPLFRLIVTLAGGIWLHRGQPDRAALDAALEVLKQGRIFGVAPEGTRSKTGALQRGREGVAFLAHRARVPLYPLVLTQTERVVEGWKRLRRPTIRVIVGQPFDLSEIDIPDRYQRLAAWTDEIMCRLAALLPPEYRGVYADHPRLKQLLAA